MTSDGEYQQSPLNQNLGFAGLAILVFMCSLSWAGLALRIWHTRRVERLGPQRRLSVSSDDTGGFESHFPGESFSPSSPVFPGSDYSWDPAPVSPVTTDSYYVDNWSV